jgi:putative transposase
MHGRRRAAFEWPYRRFPMRCARSVGHIKETPIARERDREKNRLRRKQFVEEQEALDSRHLAFVDESGFRLDSPPRYGWAPIGAKSPGKGTHGKWETMTMLGAVALNGFRGFMTIDSGTTAEVFELFVEHQLLPNLQAGDIVVMDNLSSHRGARVRELIAGTGAQLLFLPPYSPELNPIEKVWGKLKDIVRRLPTQTRDAFDAAVSTAMSAISARDLLAWIRYAGYSVA